ncbi:MAG: apolipoprotein N-acyltransferase [Nitrospirae bacterium]|nr:apolipoprotein N-acyltransferase [Nitrospirota bacterium]
MTFPDIDIYPIAWFALAPLLVYSYDKDIKTSLYVGFLFGMIFFFSTTYWIYHSIHNYGGVALVPSVMLVLFLSAYLSIYPAIFCALYSYCTRKGRLPAMFIAPFLWTSLEFVRAHALTGFPWSSIGYSQYKFLSFIQIADITGIYGVSFLLVFINSAIADLALIRKRLKNSPLLSPFPTISGFALVLLMLIFTFSYGAYRLHQNRNGKQLKAALIQGNIEQDKKWDASYQDSVINIYKNLTIAAAEQKPDIVVYPETAVPFYFGADKARTEDFISFQKAIRIPLVFGAVLNKKNKALQKTQPTEKGTLKSPIIHTNSSLLLNENGDISYSYDKIHLVPFGEYVPLRKIFFFVEKLTFGMEDYSPGHSYQRAVIPIGEFASPICYEIIFPDLVRKFFVTGGDFIVTITNDAWFGKTHGPYQHFSMAVFRAIENRKPVIRAANSGISGFIDSNGAILERTQLFERSHQVREIKTDKTRSFYTRYGDMFPYLCLLASIFILAIRSEKRDAGKRN